MSLLKHIPDRTKLVIGKYEDLMWWWVLIEPTGEVITDGIQPTWAAALDAAWSAWRDECSGCSMPDGRHWDTCPNRWDGRPTR